MTFGSMSVVEPMTLMPDSAGLASAHASAALAAFAAASAGSVTAAAGAGPGSDATGCPSAGADGSTFSPSSTFGQEVGDGASATDPTATSTSGFGDDAADDAVELSAGASGGSSAQAELVVDGSATNATAGSIGAHPVTDGAKRAEAQSTAALVEISGASSLTVSNYLMSVPPNMATATALTNELANSGQISYAAASSVFTLLDAGAALALTSG